jgi:hypothetical protein
VVIEKPGAILAPRQLGFTEVSQGSRSHRIIGRYHLNHLLKARFGGIILLEQRHDPSIDEQCVREIGNRRKRRGHLLVCPLEWLILVSGKPLFHAYGT